MSDESVNITDFLGKKWGTLLVIVVVALSTILDPIFARRNNEHTIDDIRTIVKEEIAPLALAVEESGESIQAIEDFNILDLRDRAIVAYESKIFTVEDLQPLTQNGLAVRNGLQIPEIRRALFTMDPQRTLQFERFFEGR